MPWNASSSWAAASGLLAAGPLMSPRRNHRGPSTPRKRAGRRTGFAGAGWPPGWGGGGAMIEPASSMPNGPSTSSSFPPWPDAVLAMSARTSSQIPAARGAAKAATCSSDSPARRVAPITFCWGLSSTRRSVPGSAGSRIDPRSIRAMPSFGASASS